MSGNYPQGFYQPTHRTAKLAPAERLPVQAMSDQEIDLRSFLSRFLLPDDLSGTLVEQVRRFGLAAAAEAKLEYAAETAATTTITSPTVAPWDDAPETAPATPEVKLSSDQEAAWTKLQAWAKNSERTFVLRGFAGTGKTYLLQMLNAVPGVTMLFSAPTNKAAKVLGRAVGRPAKTTHSTLGLKMEQDGEKLTLKVGDKPPYIPKNAILVVDEASMVSRVLRKAVEAAAETSGCKILWVGDPAQLPPVGEHMSTVWKATDDPACRTMLKEVMRYDNQLLALSMSIRECLKNKDWTSPVVDDHDKSGGVYLCRSVSAFERALLKGVDSSAAFVNRKVVAWRNKTVDRYNVMIRNHLGFSGEYEVGEQLMLAEPVEYNGSMIASIDDEVTVTGVRESMIEVQSREIPTWALSVEGDVSMTLAVPRDVDKLNRLLSELANDAKYAKGYQRKIAWKLFWDVKRQFHAVRYAYALTAHRIQGSTYEEIFVDQMDILANSDKRTAFRCLYVGFTRPTTRAYTY